MGSIEEAQRFIDFFLSMPISKLTYTFSNEGEVDFPAMGAFALDSTKDGAPFIRFNMEAFVYHAVNSGDDVDKKELIKDSILEVLTHEFCHSLQEYMGMELSEDVVDNILSKYKQEWAQRPTDVEEVEEAMVSASSTIELFKKLLSRDNINDVHKTINDLMPTLESWAHNR